MLGDDEFDPAMAMVQNRFDVVGPIDRVQAYGEMMDTVIERMEDLT